MDYEVDDFQNDVIDASHEAPVLVDFWAQWCGPCQQLSPVLESLAEEQDDWSLIKVNVDNHGDEAREYGVRGIPAVKLFVDGEVTAKFTGAKPEHAVRSWLDDNMPSEEKSRIEKAEIALKDGDHEEAEHLLWPVLEDDADHDEAQVLMAQALVFRDPKRARVLADASTVSDPMLRQRRESVQTITDLLARAVGDSSLPEGDGRDAYAAALNALVDRDFETAIEQFVEVVRTNREYDDDGARKACVALFTLLGENHPITQEHRRTFDMALY